MFSLISLLDRSAQIRGNEAALFEQEKSISWQALKRERERLAGAIRELGLKPDDRIAALMPNSIDLFTLIFASVCAGGVIVPINTRFSAMEISSCLQDCGAKFLFIAENHKDMLTPEQIFAAGVEEIIYYCDYSLPAASHIHIFSKLIANAKPAADIGRQGEDLAALFYTSGTTGQPKGVMLNHQGIITNILQWSCMLNLTSDDHLMIVAPMYHAAGAMNALGVAALSGKAYFLSTFDIDNMLQSIETHKITKVGLIVVMLEMIGHHPRLSDYDLSSVKKISYGGSPITETTMALAHKIFPNASLYQVYGQTEGGPTVSILEPQYHDSRDKIRSAGLPVPATSIRIIDERGDECADGVIGEITVSGPGISPGYWNRPEENKHARNGNWLKTGDAGYIDADGFLFICDRIKDMIISGGENVYSAEVENALMKYEGIVECAVIGVPDEKWGERVHAIIRLQDGYNRDEKAIITHCRALIAGYKIPRSITFREDPLPLSSSNKILKTELRKSYL